MNELKHYGVKGMKWGIRKNPELLTALRVKRKEKKRIKKTYKNYRKNGGHYLFKSARYSTGENFEKASKEFQNVMSKDKKYRELSKKAFDTEKKRLLYEKKYFNEGKKNGWSDDDVWDALSQDNRYRKLNVESEKAANAKDKRVSEVARSYVDTIKEAKLNDMNITKNRDVAKKYVSDTFYDHYWDGNLEYDPDNYYERWVDDEKFK